MPPAKPILLIVDDDERIRYLAGAAAERTGEFVEVLGAADGQAALDLLHARGDHPGAPPLLVLTDLSMPRLDGLQLTRELKAHPETRHIPVVMMTSSNRPNDRQLAFEAGCCAFFEKPLRLDDFMAMVASLPRHCVERRHDAAGSSIQNTLPLPGSDSKPS